MDTKDNTRHDSPDAAPCTLFELPIELRELIYDHVFTCRFYPLPGPGVLDHFPGLLSTSKAIRAEALSRYYKSTIFIFGWSLDVPFWLRSRPERLRDVMERIEYVIYDHDAVDLNKQVADLDHILTRKGLRLRNGVVEAVNGYPEHDEDEVRKGCPEMVRRTTR